MTVRTPWEGHPWTPRRWQAEALPRVVDAVKRRQSPVVLAVMGAGKSVLLTELAWMAEPKSAARGKVIVIIAPTQDLVRQLSATVAMRVPDVGQFFGHAKQWHRQVVVCCYASAPRLAEVLEANGREVALLIADECHRTQAPRLLDAVERMQPDAVVGFSATPFRARRGERLQLFDQVVYQYTLGQAIHDQVLVPYQFVPAADPDQTIDEACLDLVLAHRHLGPTVVSSDTIADAEAFADLLREQDVSVDVIHSRRPPGERDEVLAALREGQLEVLVHVRMLSEGVDFPWLRVICLRAKRGSPVLFMQEFGRVLRVLKEPDGWGAKKVGVILDPHDHFGHHNLAHEPMLGMPEPQPEGQGNREGLDEDVPQHEQGGFGFDDEPPPMAVPVGPVEHWARSLCQALAAQGVRVRQRRESRELRGLRPSQSQQTYLRGLAERLAGELPNEHRDALRVLLTERPDSFSRGACSDLISALQGARDAGGWPDHLWVHTLDLRALEGAA